MNTSSILCFNICLYYYFIKNIKTINKGMFFLVHLGVIYIIYLRVFPYSVDAMYHILTVSKVVICVSKIKHITYIIYVYEI